MSTEKTRVCMLLKNSFTHDARVLREAKTLVANDYDVTVVALSAKNLPERETTADGIHVIRVSRGVGSSLHAVSDPSQSKQTQRKVLKRIKGLAVTIIKLVAATPLGEFIQKSIDNRMRVAAMSVSPDVIHAHDLDTLEVGVDISSIRNIPLIYDSHEIASQRNHHSAARKRRSYDVEKKLITAVDRMIMVSRGCAEYTAEIYNIATPDVIMNCPDLPDGSSQQRSLRKALDIPDSDFLVVHQGSLQRNRGVEETIEAISQIPGCTLVIIGFGQHRIALEQHVTDRGLDHKVKFFGPVPSKELIEWTASADLGIATIVGESKSYLYSMPNKLFEYVVAGLPVIASDYPDMGTFVRENQIGLLCNPKSVNDIRDAIITLKNDPAMRHQFAKNSSHAKAKYNWQVEQEKLLSLYRETVPTTFS